MAEKRKLTAKDCERLNIPEEFWRAKVAGVQESVRPLVVNYCSKIEANVVKPAGLILSGEAGVGKTAIASIILKEARCHGHTGYFIPIWELRECIRSKVQFDADQSVFERCRSVNLLVLDDFAEEQIDDYTFGLRHLTDLILHRTSHNKATIITSKMPDHRLIELEDFLIRVKGSMLLVTIEGMDLREIRSQELMNDLLGDLDGSR